MLLMFIVVIACLLLTQDIPVYHALLSISANSAPPCLLVDSPHAAGHVIAIIDFTVHKSSLCECTFDKVYLFICKHLIIQSIYLNP